MVTIRGRASPGKRIGLDKEHRTPGDLGNGLVRGRNLQKPTKDWDIDWLV